MGSILEKLMNRGKPRGGSKAARISLVVIAVMFIAYIALNAGHILNDFREMGRYLQYGFVRRALLAGTLVSLCAALLGVTLVLKRYSMIGDGLSHVGFGALSIAAAMGFVTVGTLPNWMPGGLKEAIVSICAGIAYRPMVFTLGVVIVMAFVILRISSASDGIKGDAAVAILSTSALALGVLVTSLTSGMNVDLMNYMFGSILAMSGSDVLLSVCLSICALVLFILFYIRIFAVTFDETFARATGTRVGFCNAMIALLTALTVVVGMRMMGTMLISSLIIFPALSSMRLFNRFRNVLISSAVVSVFCFAIGIMLSCVHGVPTGAAVVLTDLAVFLLFSLIENAR